MVTGDIGSGKSTALRYVAATLHPSEYRIIPITATPGSILDLYRFLLAGQSLLVDQLVFRTSRRPWLPGSSPVATSWASLGRKWRTNCSTI